MDPHDWPYPPSVRPAARTRSPPRFFVLLDDKLYPTTSTSPEVSNGGEGKYQFCEIKEEYRPPRQPPRRTDRTTQTIGASHATAAIDAPKRWPFPPPAANRPQQPVPPQPATIPPTRIQSAQPLHGSEKNIVTPQANATTALTKKGPPLPDQKEAYAAFRTHAQRVGQNTSRPRGKSKPWFRPKHRKLCPVSNQTIPKDDRIVKQDALRPPSSDPGFRIKGTGREVIDLTTSSDEGSGSNNRRTRNHTVQSCQNTAPSATVKQETPRPPLPSLKPIHQPTLPGATNSNEQTPGRDVQAHSKMSQAELKMRQRGWQPSIAVTASIPPSQPKLMSTPPHMPLAGRKEVKTGSPLDRGRNVAFKPGRLYLNPENKADHPNPNLNFPTAPSSPRSQEQPLEAAAVDVDVDADMAMDIDTDIDLTPSSSVSVGMCTTTDTETTFGRRGGAIGPIFGLPSTLGRPSCTGTGSFSPLAGRAGAGSGAAATSNYVGGGVAVAVAGSTQPAPSCSVWSSTATRPSLRHIVDVVVGGGGGGGGGVKRQFSQIA